MPMNGEHSVDFGSTEIRVKYLDRIFNKSDELYQVSGFIELTSVWEEQNVYNNKKSESVGK